MTRYTPAFEKSHRSLSDIEAREVLVSYFGNARKLEPEKEAPQISVNPWSKRLFCGIFSVAKAALYLKVFPEAPKTEVRNVLGQIWRFRHDMQRGDLVALPLKSQKAVAIGKITGDYEFKDQMEIPSTLGMFSRLK